MIMVVSALAAFLMSPNVPNVIQATPFSLNEVQLTDGRFKHAEEVCSAYLLKVEPDRLLSNFRVHSGLQAKGKIYGGWENSGLAGHSLGHYLSACAQEYASHKDPKFKEKVDYIVSELVACQKSRPDGYISAIPDGDTKWAEVRKGNIKSGGFDLNGMWSPWYTHHKVLAGLLDAYHLTGNKDALDVAKKFGDWAIDETKDLTPDQWQNMLRCEYGGMNESLAEIYSLTKEQKYLDLSRKFYDHVVLDPLKKGVDSMPGKHSNTNIPKLIGLARLYELEGKPDDLAASRNFWDAVVNHHTYSIGGNSNHEYMGQPDKLSDQLSSNTCETCNTYNMLKLTRHLFMWDPKASYFDYYERAHLNHILASQDPHGPGVTYFMPLGSGESRNYSSPFNDWTCCHGSGMENHTKHADSIYFHSGNQKLYVNLFIPSEVHWNGVSVRQDTKFPDSDSVKLTVDGNRSFEIAIRHPGWAKDPIDVKVNGKKVLTSSKPSSYMSIKRAWKMGDVVEFRLPMKLHTEAMPDNLDRVSVLYGPVVLAATMGAERAPKPRIPVLVTHEKDLTKWLKPVAGSPLHFKTESVGQPNQLEMVPFFDVDHERYAVYLDLFTEDQWKAEEAKFRAEEERVRDLVARTIDSMRVGEMQPERDHKLESEKNDVRQANGRSFRTPLNGGWFQVSMKVQGDAANELVVSYWGNDRLRPDFDILVDGTVISSETLKGRPANEFYDVTYPIPAELTKGKSTVSVKVQAKGTHSAGSFCGLRIVKAK